MKKLMVGVIGTGLQANRRLPSIEHHVSSSLEAITGLDQDKVDKIARTVGARNLSNWQQMVNDEKLDIIVICTPPNIHFDIAKAALESGKHVLCEKPLTLNSDDAKKLIATANQNKVLLKCGFNHRYYPAMQEAYSLFIEGKIGAPITGRAVYGICGRKNCENEWRSDPNVVSGGQLMEQGIHVIDLFRWFIGEFEAVSAHVATHVFPIKPLEDTATALLYHKDGIDITVHSSITQWRNKFQFELYGSEGYFVITGLGGSYDLQQLRIGKRDPNAPFSEQVIDYRGSDNSWSAEWKDFMESILNGTQMIGTGLDGAEAIKIIEAAYLASKERRRVVMKEINHESI